MIEYILTKMDIIEFQDGASRELAKALLELYEEYKEQSLTAIERGQLRIDEPVRQLIAGLLMRQHEISKGWVEKKIVVPELNEDAKRAAQQGMRRVKQRILKNQIKELGRKVLSSGEGSKDQLDYQEEYREKSQLLLFLEEEDCFDK